MLRRIALEFTRADVVVEGDLVSTVIPQPCRARPMSRLRETQHNLFVTGNHIRFEDVEGNFVYNNTFLQEARSADEGHFLTWDACFAPGSYAGTNFTICTF